MQKLGLGAKHEFIITNDVFPLSLSGMILLDVENHGEAYYINPLDLHKYYLSRPRDAFALMRELGLGITNNDLLAITPRNIDDEKNIGFLLDNKVPFIAQAPFANWSDQRQQDGCEEASALMAVRWARNESLTKEDGLDNILRASDYELEKYGEYRDISTSDTVNWIFKDYFSFNNVVLRKNTNVKDIIKELTAGNLIIVPVDGRLLNNQYFTPPGPSRHMLIIRGYDIETDEFLTNDPGTKHGEAFRYKKNILINAIRDYPTGHHEYIEIVKKNMIVVGKE
jgi:hypothetical protein